MNKTLLMLLIPVALFSQSNKSCDQSQSSDLENFGSIFSTKCTISKLSKDGGRSREISVKVSAPIKARFLKKRTPLKKNLAALTSKLSKEEMKKAQKFTTVDEIPTFKKCAKQKGLKRLDCFNSQMISHIERHFSYPDQALIKKIQGEVWVRFIIDKNGNVSNIKALGPKNGELLKEEAIRVVSNLPVFSPAVKDGKNISVKYGFPITFSLN